MADPQLVTAIAGAAATVISSTLYVIGKRRNGDTPKNGDQGVVSLTKQLMADKNRDLDRNRKTIAELDRKTRQLEAKVAQLTHELDYAHARISQLGGP